MAMATATVNVKIQDIDEVRAVIDAAIGVLREVEHEGQIKSWAQSIADLWTALDRLQSRFPPEEIDTP